MKYRLYDCINEEVVKTFNSYDAMLAGLFSIDSEIVGHCIVEKFDPVNWCWREVTI